MKRYVRASKFKEIDSVNFASSLVNALKQLLPKNCYPKVNSQYNEIIVENVPSRVNKLHDATAKALKMLGYDVYEIADFDDEGYELAAVKGEAFVKLAIDIGDYFNSGSMGYIDMKYNNGNVLFEDWYED